MQVLVDADWEVINEGEHDDTQQAKDQGIMMARKKLGQLT
jgi:hypothetical protein